MTPDRDNLIQIDDSYEVEKIIYLALKAQFFSHNIPTDSITPHQQKNVPDGGIDISIQGPLNLPPTLGLGTNNNVILQIKHSGGYLPLEKIKKEIDKNEVKNFFITNNGGAYVLCYSKKVPSQGKKAKTSAERLSELNQALNEVLDPNTVKGIILYPDDLIEWIKRSPASWQYFPLASQYYFANSKTLSFLEEQGSFTEQFKDNFVGEKRQEDLEKLKKWIKKNNDPFLEIRGNMGVGKTRLVYQAVKDCQLEDICLWFNSPDEFKTDRIREFLYSQNNSTIKLFCVVDESNKKKYHSILKNLAENFSNKIRIISILPFRDSEADTRGDYIFEVKPMIKEDLHSVINNYPLEQNVKNRIITLCDGYPKLAVLLAKRIVTSTASPNYQEAIDLLNSDFKDRTTEKGWVDLILDNDDFKALSVLSCLLEVRRETNEQGDEIECICEIFNLERSEVEKVIEKNKRKGLISSHSNYIYITPLILANHLAKEVFQYEKEKIEDLINKLEGRYRPGFNQTPIKSFITRFEMLLESDTDDKLKNKYKIFLDNNSMTKDVLQKKNLSELILIMATYYPEEFLNRFYSDIKSMDIEDIKSDEEGRSDIVSFLRKSAFYPALFNISFRILYKLALAENEIYSNNATGLFSGYCSPELSGSEAPLRERIDIFIELLENHYQESPELFAKCIELFISPCDFLVIDQRNKLKIPEVKTENDELLSKDDHIECFNKLWKVLVEKFDIRQEKNKPLWMVICSNIRSIPQYCLEDSEKLNYLLNNGKEIFSTEILGSLIDIKEYDFKTMPSEAQKTLESSINQLDSGMEALLKRVLFDSLSDDLGKDREEKVQGRITELTNKIINEPSLLEEHKTIILSEKSKHRNNWFFIQLGMKDTKQVLWKFLSNWNQTKQQRSLVCSYINGIWEGDKETTWSDDCLDEISKDDIYEKELIFYTSQNILTERSFKRMLSSMKLITLSQSECFNLFRIPLRKYNQNQVGEVIESINNKWGLKGFVYIIMELSWYLQKNELLNNRCKQLLLKALFTEFTSTMDEYCSFEIILPILLNDGELKKAMIGVFKEVLNNTLTNDYKFETNKKNSKGLRLIAKKYTGETYQVFKTLLSKEKDDLYRLKFTLKDFKKWLVPIHETHIKKDLGHFSLDQLVNILILSPDGLKGLNDVTKYAMENYEYNEQISRVIINKICDHSEAWIGSSIGHYTGKLEQFSSWSENNNLEKNNISKEIKKILNSFITHYQTQETEEEFLSRND